MRSKLATANEGFTLLEITVVVIIMGILLVPLFQMYDTYVYDQKRQITKDHIATIQTELSIYRVKYGEYPCPADRSLPSTDPMYGKELRTGGHGTACTLSALAVGTCIDTPKNGSCRAIGQRDVAPVDGNPDPVLIGSVPFVTLADEAGGGNMTRKVTIEDSLDGWNNKITYAVTESLTTRGTYDNLNGSISVVDEFGNNVGGTLNDAHFALISHGPDGRGGFSREGERFELCASAMVGVPGGVPDPDVPYPPGSPSLSDTSNCLINSMYVKGLDKRDITTELHYDDIMDFGMAATTELWDYVYDTTTGAPQNQIRNLNVGNVGIKNATPTQALDVNGDIRAETRIRTNTICDANGANCFNPNILTDTPVSTPISAAMEGVDGSGNAKTPGIRCANGRVMSGISQGDEQCATMSLPATFTARNCGVVSGHQTKLIGITTTGQIICSNGG